MHTISQCQWTKVSSMWPSFWPICERFHGSDASELIWLCFGMDDLESVTCCSVIVLHRDDISAFVLHVLQITLFVICENILVRLCKSVGWENRPLWLTRSQAGCLEVSVFPIWSFVLCDLSNACRPTISHWTPVKWLLYLFVTTTPVACACSIHLISPPPLMYRIARPRLAHHCN